MLGAPSSDQFSSQGLVAAPPAGSYTGTLTVDKAKFRRPVVPGDRIEYHMQKMSKRKNMWWFRGEAKVDGQLACEAELGAMLGP